MQATDPQAGAGFRGLSVEFIPGLSKLAAAYRQRNISGWLLFFASIVLVVAVKLVTIRGIGHGYFFGTYSVLVCVYILSRFLLAWFYRPNLSGISGDYTPTLSFGVPSKNEADNICETILRIAKSDYPKDKFNIIAVNDGSTDNTLQEMLRAKELAAKEGVEVIVVDWSRNRGKREGMAECIWKSEAEVVVFIDSDSFVEVNTARELVKYFADERIAAVAGHAFVANSDRNILTKMQAVRYYVAFKAYKAAEALFGSVICCSGCCSAYRRSYVLEVLEDWKAQAFLGIRCTYGDDRSLTNYLLRKDYLTLYSPSAIVRTFVPDELSKFMRQQLRWKKSWVRESLMAGRFMWKRNLVMSVSFYLGVILPLLAPIMVARALVWCPFAMGQLPLLYLSGLGVMAFVYGLYYRAHVKDRKWIYGVLFAALFPALLVWQLPWAILNIRDARWGTR